MPRHAKHTKIARDEQMLAGVRKQLAGKTLYLDGVRWTAAALENAIENHIAALRQTDARYAAWRESVALEARLEKETSQLLLWLEVSVRAQFGNRATELADFGLAPKSRRKPSSTTKVAAVAKAATTRKMRHTVGKRQRAKIKG